MNKHTPGPWRITNTPHDLDFCSEVSANEVDVAAIYTSSGAGISNARLIASAPDLLEALQACQEQLQKLTFKDGGITNALGKAFAAIAKATGVNA